MDTFKIDLKSSHRPPLLQESVPRLYAVTRIYSFSVSCAVSLCFLFSNAKLMSLPRRHQDEILYMCCIYNKCLANFQFPPDRSSSSLFPSTLPSIISWTAATTSTPSFATSSGFMEPSSSCSSLTSGSRLT